MVSDWKVDEKLKSSCKKNEEIFALKHPSGEYAIEVEQLWEEHEIAQRLKHEINMMEKAEVDVQNWLSEEGHKGHTAILNYLKQKIRDGK